MPTTGRNGTPPPPKGGGGRGKGGPPGPRRGLKVLPGRQLALLGVAGESVGVLAGAAGWRLSGEPAWLVMSGVSLALALVLLKRV
jgi:hypothetical protein